MDTYLGCHPLEDTRNVTAEAYPDGDLRVSKQRKRKMYNLLDLVQLELNKKNQKIDRQTVEAVLSTAIEVTKETAAQGNDVFWVGLCKFTWKKKATTKKAAAHWKEFPYEADGDKLRIVPLAELEELDAKGLIFKTEKPNEQAE